MFKKFQANAKPPVLLIHGGAGAKGEAEIRKRRQAFLEQAIATVWPELLAGKSAVEAVNHSIELLEGCALFNAGFGAVLQSDGLARLSASLMDGKRQKFSAVQLATHIIHPSKLAAALQNKRESVVGPLGAQLIARELGIPPENPVAAEQAWRWADYRGQLESNPPEGGTVGAVAWDRQGCLAAATSTGGGHFNFPERISDSATIAGNYASPFAALSCTGAGEQIIDDGVAIRLETRVRDGKTLIEAAESAFEEAQNRKHQYGWIGIDRQGNWVLYCSTEDMACAAMSPELNTAFVR